MDKDETLPINAGEMPIDLVEKLDAMCAEDETSRSGFFRKMIRQEWARRQQANFLPTVDSGSGKTKKPTGKIVAVAAA